jgi:hypothetical protein
MPPGRLDPRAHYKPLDLGNGIISACITPSGRWLEVGIAHRDHGRVVVSDTPALEETKARDQGAVRAYRRALASRDRAGFGLDALATGGRASLLEDSLPTVIHARAALRLEATAFVPAGRRAVVQVVRITAKRDLRFAPAWTGAMHLRRAAYTQLTPGGPLPGVAEAPASGRDERGLWIVDEALDAAVGVVVPSPVTIAARASTTCVAVIAFGRTPDEALAEASSIAVRAEARLAETLQARRALWTGADLASPRRAPLRRAAAYALDCASLEVGESTAILADHVILPLVWTRDAYYVCRAMLSIAPEQGAAMTSRFLRWCFETAERPDGWWPRASLASGVLKDPIFQLDQQIYPLLLLADHARLTKDYALARRYNEQCDGVVRALLERRSTFGLIATDETPADDPIEAPFHFSSHVLLWRLLRERDPAAADKLRDATRRHFVAGDLYAYAVRGPKGEGAVLYHDANDLPTMFAPGWRFCRSNDPRWKATIAFAWSKDNRAFVEGAFGGLGSVHTLHPWPLGDLQDVVVGRVLHDRTRVSRARARLRAVRMWDGMLPEAYDETSGAVASRHWFAWPIALWALLEHEPALTAP